MDGNKEYLINNEGKLPTTTAGQSRVQVYEPTKSPKEQIRKHETAWGSATIDGKLGQNHASLMEAIFFHAEDLTKNEDGSVNIIVDPYKVRKALGGGVKEYSYSTMMLYRRDIMKALVELKIKNTDVEISVMTHKKKSTF